MQLVGLVALREPILLAYKDTQRGWDLSINTWKPSASPLTQPSDLDTASQTPAAESHIPKFGMHLHHQEHTDLVSSSWEPHFWHSLAEVSLLSKIFPLSVRNTSGLDRYKFVVAFTSRIIV